MLCSFNCFRTVGKLNTKYRIHICEKFILSQFQDFIETQTDKVQKVNRPVAEQTEKGSVEERKAKDASKGLKNEGKLFVGGLNYATTSNRLQHYFSQFGEVIDTVVLKYPDSGRSRGFGFVMFAKPSDAENTLQHDYHVLDGKIIDVRPIKPAPNVRKKEGTKVFLGGLSDSTSPEVLKQFFGRYGEISKVIIPVDKNTKKPRGFGFLWFKDEEDAEKCVAEDFVHLGGRRIHIKIAEPRGRSRTDYTRDTSVDIGVDPLGNDTVFVDDFLEDMESTSVVDNETSSTASGERSEVVSKLQQSFENFFSLKLEKFNTMNEMKTERENGNFQELLSELLKNHSKENSTSDEDLIIFSDSESEESSNFGDEETDPQSDSDDSEDYTNSLEELSIRFTEMLTGMENSSLNEDDGDIQNSISFKFRDKEGSLFCSLCQWTSLDNSYKSFLTHCRSHPHRMKLKGRFLRESSQGSKATEGSKEAEERDSSLKSFPQKPLATIGQEISKKQDKIQPQGKVEVPKKKQEILRNVTCIGTKTVKKGETVRSESAAKNSNAQKKEKESLTVTEFKNLKMMALAKGMSCIQPLSSDELKCNMCNKVIPKALDFSILMKNVSGHLQSKGHLKKLLETENSLKASLEEVTNFEKNPPNQKTIRGQLSTQEKKIPNQKNIQEKPFTQEKKIPNQKNIQEKPSTQEKKIPNQKNIQEKPSTQEKKICNQKNIQEKPFTQEKKIPNQKNIQEKPSTQEKKIPNQKNIQEKPSTQEKKISNQKNIQEKPSTQEKKISNQKNIKEKPSTQEKEISNEKCFVKENRAEKREYKISAPKILFLCVPCNYFNKSFEIFKAHLTSQLHVDCFTSRGLSLDSSLDSLTKCESCGHFLYGSLFYINKHYSKCSEKND